MSISFRVISMIQSLQFFAWPFSYINDTGCFVWNILEMKTNHHRNSLSGTLTALILPDSVSWCSYIIDQIVIFVKHIAAVVPSVKYSSYFAINIKLFWFICSSQFNDFHIKSVSLPGNYSIIPWDFTGHCLTSFIHKEINVKKISSKAKDNILIVF